MLLDSRGLRPRDPLTRGFAPGPHWEHSPQTIASRFWPSAETVEDVSVCNILMHTAHKTFHDDALYKFTLHQIH